jgi:hypothetical protein
MTDMNEHRLLAIISAYGAETEQWPTEEREAALALLETSADARVALDEAAGVDARLAEATPLPVSLRLQARIAAIAEPNATGITETIRQFWPFGPIWRPASGLAAAAIIGLAVGIGTPGEDVFMTTAEAETYTDFVAASGGEIEESLQ